MVKHIFLALLIAASLLVLCTRPVSCQTTQIDEQAQKIKRYIEKYGLSEKVSVRLKNGEELYGTILQINDEDFTISEVDVKQTITIQYKNVKKVWKGYGGKLITGKRQNPRKSIWIGLGVLGGLIALVALSIPKT
jgi:small nuclear ribonucleoprotein (snRNP)-like protein